MSFARPELLGLALLAPLGLLLSLLRRPALEIALGSLSGPNRRAETLRGWRRAAIAGSLGAFVGIIALAAALAGPTWGGRALVFKRTGLEIALVIDVSRSMEALDTGPSRRLAALETARRIIDAAPGASFSLVAAKGGASLLLPLTEDGESLVAALEYAEPGLSTAAGTDLGAGLREADRSFSRLAGAERIVILLSDGGDLAGTAGGQAAALAATGRRLVVIGLGLDQPVTAPDPEGKPIVDSRGLPVLVPREEGMLRALARAGSGSYLRAEEEKALGDFIDGLGELGIGGSFLEYERRDRRPLLALVAFLGFGLRAFAEAMAFGGGSYLGGSRRGGRRPGGGSRRVAPPGEVRS